MTNRKRKSQSKQIAITNSQVIANELRKLEPSGPEGFEGLIAKLMSRLTGTLFTLARAGSQSGTDMTSDHLPGNLIAAECKRYGNGTELDERELLGEIFQAASNIPDLDFWVLVASRPVPAQLIESLRKLGYNMGVEVYAIWSGDVSPGYLDILCACLQDVTVNHLAQFAAGADVNALSQVLGEISRDPSFAQSVEQIRSLFFSSSVGFGNAREVQNGWFIDRCSSEPKSRASFGQVLNVADSRAMVIKRTDVSSKLDEWLLGWETKPNLMVLTGEEGDGKTWALANWLADRIRSDVAFPLVLFLSSITVSSDDPERLFLESLGHGEILATDRRWQRRLERWMKRPRGAKPLMVIVLDGINERWTSTFWRGLLEKLTVSPWNTQIALIVTCRTGFWRNNFGKLRYLEHKETAVPSYSNSELSEALQKHGLAISDLPTSILPLIRKPRYFDLMLKHKQRMAESGDVTPARLIYEDWRDRFERKTNMPLSYDDFQDLIRDIARKYQDGNSCLDAEQMGRLLSFRPEIPHILQELTTGGILLRESGNYQVRQERLIQGFGLLLADEVIEAQMASAPDLNEVIANWLEPQAEMDIKSAICGAAVLHSLVADTYPQEGRVALLSAWLGTHNPTTEGEEAFPAYVPQNPKCYLALAEQVWSSELKNPWGQELIMRALMRWRGAEKVTAALIPAFERWLGYVPRDGDPLLRQNPNSDLAEIRSKIMGRVGHELVLGEFEFSGYPLTLVNNDDLLPLGQFALALISYMPREQFIRAMAIACAAESIAGFPRKHDLIAWTLRTSPTLISEQIQDEARHMIQSGSETAKKAAYYLLSFEASSESIQLRDTLPNDLFPENPAWEHYRKDPCVSGWSWQGDDVELCLKRGDLDSQWVARQMKRFCINPALSVPDDLGDRLAPVVTQIPSAALWREFGRTSDDYLLEEVEPALCAYAPHALVPVIQGVALDIDNRTEIPLRQLALQLREYLPLLDIAERGAIKKAWMRLQEMEGSWTEAEKVAEWALFSLVLQTEPDADQQLDHLLMRKGEAPDLVKFEPLFNRTKNNRKVLQLLEEAADVKTVQRVILFIRRSIGDLDENVTQKLRPYLSNEDSFVRALAMQALFLAKDKVGLDGIVHSSWTYGNERLPYENHWGSLVLCRFGLSLPYEELRNRVLPKHLGYAVRQRGAKSDEVAKYATDLHRMWQKLMSNQVELPIDLPFIQVDRSLGDKVSFDATGLSQSEFSRSVTYKARNTFWGGFEKDASDLNFFFSLSEPSFLERQEKLLSIAKHAIQEQHDAGNELFSQYFPNDCLEEAFEARTDLFDEMIAAVVPDTREVIGLLVRGQGFCEALCRILLKKKPEVGVMLSRKLGEAPFVRLVHNGIRLLDYSLFAISDDPVIIGEWNRRLEQCKTDQELMELVIVAENGNRQEWLKSRVDEGLASQVPMLRARALSLLAFVDGEWAKEFLEREGSSGPDTWLTSVGHRSLLRWQTNAWAKHWFTRFLTVTSDVDSWAAFRLFLECVDRRFYTWRNRIISDSGIHTGKFDRLVFLESQVDTVKNKIKNNEGQLKDTFMTEKVLDNQAWPWINIAK